MRPKRQDMATATPTETGIGQRALSDQGVAGCVLALQLHTPLLHEALQQIVHGRGHPRFGAYLERAMSFYRLDTVLFDVTRNNP